MVSTGWLLEVCQAIVARVRDRNPMEVADDLGHPFWRLSAAFSGLNGTESINDH